MVGFVCGVALLGGLVAAYLQGRESAWDRVESEESYRYACTAEWNQKYGQLSQRYRDLVRDRDRLTAKISGMEIDFRREMDRSKSIHAAQLRERTEAACEQGRSDARTEFADRIRELADEFAETDEAEDDSD